MLSEEEAHHLVRVRRCGEGDLAEGLLPGWKITLRLFARENAWFGEECSRSAEGREDLFMVLLVALLKGEAFEKLLFRGVNLQVQYYSCMFPEWVLIPFLSHILSMRYLFAGLPVKQRLLAGRLKGFSYQDRCCKFLQDLRQP